MSMKMQGIARRFRVIVQLFERPVGRNPLYPFCAARLLSHLMVLTLLPFQQSHFEPSHLPAVVPYPAGHAYTTLSASPISRGAKTTSARGSSSMAVGVRFSSGGSLG